MSYRKNTTAKTAVHAGSFELTTPQGNTSQFENMDEVFDSIPPEEEGDHHSRMMVGQQEIHDSHLIHKLSFVREVGRGGYSIAYLANFRYNDTRVIPCVVKLVKVFLEMDIFEFVNGGEKIFMSSDGFRLLKRAPTSPNIDLRKGVENFKREVKNLIRIHNPEKLLYRQFFDSHSRLVSTPASQLGPLREEMARIRSHSGHNFIHKFIHYDPVLYFILSEPCDGTAQEIIDREESDPPTCEDKRHFMLHLGLAVDYLLSVIKVAHTDIKPANVFYTRSTARDTRFHFKLSDFGYLDDVPDEDFTSPADQLPQNSNYIGTRRYCPHAVVQKRIEAFSSSTASPYYINSAKLMLFNFCASILCFFNTMSNLGPDNVQKSVNENLRLALRYKGGKFADWKTDLSDVYGQPMMDFVFKLMQSPDDYWFNPETQSLKAEWHAILQSTIERMRREGCIIL